MSEKSKNRSKYSLFDKGYRDLIVLDFDNTIYYNPENNFSSSIDKNSVKNAPNFFFDLINQGNFTNVFNPYFVLFTGRSYEQQEQIKSVLLESGYTFDETHFFVPNNFPSKTKFLQFYLEWKVSIIEYLLKRCVFGRKIVIDDDKRVLNEILGKFYDVETYLAQYEYHQKVLCLTFKKANNLTNTFEYCNPYYQLIFS